MSVAIKRVYDPPAPGDGYRVLVDRVWPRGLSRTRAGLDDWRRELAPSDALRRWFGHDPVRWPEFRRRYREELEAPEARVAMAELAARARRGRVTLLYGASDTRHNNAVVLQERLADLARAARGQRLGTAAGAAGRGSTRADGRRSRGRG